MTIGLDTAHVVFITIGAIAVISALGVWFIYSANGGSTKRSRLKRKTPLKPMSDKRRRAMPNHKAFVKRFLAEHEWCAACRRIYQHTGARYGAFQPRRAGHVHHTILRSQGGKDTDEGCLAVCWLCHDWIHHNDEQATILGLIVRRNAT